MKQRPRGTDLGTVDVFNSTRATAVADMGEPVTKCGPDACGPTRGSVDGIEKVVSDLLEVIRPEGRNAAKAAERLNLGAP